MMLALIMAIENEEDRSFVLDIYNQYEKSIYAYAYTMTDDEEYSRDCVHDVIKIVIEELDTFKEFSDNRKVKFMMVCCKHSVYNKYSFKQRIYQPLNNFSQNEEKEYTIDIPDEIPDICEELINNETRAKLHKCIKQLNQLEQDILTLRYECELPTKKIAKLLNLSDDAVRQRLVRIHKEIKKIGGKELYDLFK
ncbi:MAG: sigma-70 family RNA polymerase sigma factor [Clostridia bacterium]|nr:sigma-70 family RNA polymerase sigma factor [Clostridia bacterium]